MTEFTPDPIYRCDADTIYFFNHVFTEEEVRAIIEKAQKVLEEKGDE